MKPLFLILGILGGVSVLALVGFFLVVFVFVDHTTDKIGEFQDKQDATRKKIEDARDRHRQNTPPVVSTPTDRTPSQPVEQPRIPFPDEKPPTIDDPDAKLTITMARGGSGLIYPTTAKPIRFIGMHNADRSFQIWDLNEERPTLELTWEEVEQRREDEKRSMQLAGVSTLSEDGTLIAGFVRFFESKKTKVGAATVVQNKMHTGIEIWEPMAEEPKASVALGRSEGVDWLAFGSTNDRIWSILSKSANNELRVWDLAKQLLIAKFEFGEGVAIETIAIDPARKQLALRDREHLWVLRPEEGQIVAKVPLSPNNQDLPNTAIRTLQFSPDGKKLSCLCVGPNGLLYAFDLDPNEPETPEHAFGVPRVTTGWSHRRLLQYSPDGKTLLCEHKWLIDAATGMPLHQIQRPEQTFWPDHCPVTERGLLVEVREQSGWKYIAMFDPGWAQAEAVRAAAGSLLCASLPRPEKADTASSKVANLDAATEWKATPEALTIPKFVDSIKLPQRADEIVAVAFSRPARWALVLSLVQKTEPFEHQILVGDRYDLTTGERDAGFRTRPPRKWEGLGRDGWKPMLDLSPDGTRCVFAHPEERTWAHVFDVVSGEHVRSFAFPTDRPWLALGDSETLIAEQPGKGLTGWSIKDGERLWSMPLGTESQSMTMSPDNRFLAYVTRTGRGYLLDPVSGESKGILPANFGDNPSELSFIPDGKQLAALQRNRTNDALLVARFDLETGVTIDQRKADLKFSHPFEKPFRLVGEDRFLLSTGELLDFKTGGKIWDYQSPEWEHRPVPSPDGRQWFITAEGADQPAQLRAVELPGPEVETILANMKSGELKLIYGPKRGAQIQIVWNGPKLQSDLAEMQKNLVEDELFSPRGTVAMLITAKPAPPDRMLDVELKREFGQEPVIQQMPNTRVDVQIVMTAGGRTIYERKGTVDSGLPQMSSYPQALAETIPERAYLKARQWVWDNLPDRLYAGGGQIVPFPGRSALPR